MKVDGGHVTLLGVILILCIILILASLKIEYIRNTTDKDLPTVSDSVSTGGYCCMEGLR